MLPGPKVRPSRDGSADPPCPLVAWILVDPPSFPGWGVNRWRRLLGSDDPPDRIPDALGNVRVGPLLAWIAERTAPEMRLAAVAGALAALDHAVHQGELDPLVVAERLGTAAATSRPLRTRSSIETVAVTSWDLEQEPAPPLSADDESDSPLATTAGQLLRQAGLDIRAHPGLARRLAATLDIAIDHWLEGAERGGGLPAFRDEHRRFYGQRLIVKLGVDRDLLRLLAGPHPGRGRDRQTAWQRGLTYWVARVWSARVTGSAPPVIPPEVIAHWRGEIGGLIPPGAPEMGYDPDSRYAAIP